MKTKAKSKQIEVITDDRRNHAYSKDGSRVNPLNGHQWTPNDCKITNRKGLWSSIIRLQSHHKLKSHNRLTKKKEINMRVQTSPINNTVEWSTYYPKTSLRHQFGANNVSVYWSSESTGCMNLLYMHVIYN